MRATYVTSVRLGCWCWQIFAVSALLKASTENEAGFVADRRLEKRFTGELHFGLHSQQDGAIYIRTDNQSQARSVSCLLHEMGHFGTQMVCAESEDSATLLGGFVLTAYEALNQWKAWMVSRDAVAFFADAVAADTQAGEASAILNRACPTTAR